MLMLFCVNPLAAAADQANVFIYHRFNDNRYPSTNISITEFRAHLQLLADQNYTVLTLGQVVGALSEGTPLPERCAVITVDDAFRSFMTDAWPALKEFGFPVTLFVNTDQTYGGDFLTWAELKQLQAEGVEMGNHSAAHLYLLDRSAGETTEQWRKRVTDDIRSAQVAFRDQLGKAPELFAYPYGEFSNELARLVADLGFRAAVGQQSGVVTSGQDMYKLPRFPMGGGGEDGLSDFRQKLRMRHLPVQTAETQDTVMNGENPPALKFFVNFDEAREETLRCYASGGLSCEIEKLPGGRGFVAKASGKIVARRGKYTFTASDASGRNWYWYSHLWVLARGPMADDPVAGRD